MGQFVVVWSFPRFYPSPAKSTAPERDFARASPLLTPKITHGRVVMLNKDPPPGFSPAKLRCCGHWRSSGRRPCTRNSRCEPRSSIGNYLYTGILMYIYIYICICIYLYACVCVLWILYIYTYVCVCGLSIGVCIYIYLFIFKKKVCVCVCVCSQFPRGCSWSPFSGDVPATFDRRVPQALPTRPGKYTKSYWNGGSFHRNSWFTHTKWWFSIEIVS